VGLSCRFSSDGISNSFSRCAKGVKTRTVDVATDAAKQTIKKKSANVTALGFCYIYVQ